MGLASGHCGLEHAGDPNPGNGFADFDYAGAPGGQNINTLLDGSEPGGRSRGHHLSPLSC